MVYLIQKRKSLTGDCKDGKKRQTSKKTNNTTKDTEKLETNGLWWHRKKRRHSNKTALRSGSSGLFSLSSVIVSQFIGWEVQINAKNSRFFKETNSRRQTYQYVRVFTSKRRNFRKSVVKIYATYAA